MGKGIFFLYLLGLSLWDVKERRVPVILLVLGSIAAGSVVAYGMATGRIRGVELILGAIPGLSLLLTAWLTGKAGYADGIVLLCCGIVWGYREALLILCLSLVLISFVSIALLLLHKVKRQSRIPYIPFLAVGFWLAEFMGK